MVISYVVRLRPDALADGRFVGEIEAVTSRQRRSIRTIDQMAAFMLATNGSQVRAAAAAHRQVSEENEGQERAERAEEPEAAGEPGVAAVAVPRWVGR